MSRYHGKKGAVYVSTTASGDAAAIAMTEWSLDMATDKVETTSFQDANKTYVQGLKDLNGSFAGVWDNVGSDLLFDAAESADGVKIYLYPSTDIPTYYWYGPAWLDASINTSVDGRVEVSGSFVANGAWGRKP